MLVDGKAIAAALFGAVQNAVSILPQAPRLSAVTCAPNFETKKYLAMKQTKAAAVGIILTVVELPADVTTAMVVDSVTKAAAESDGVVVQLPLPAQVDRAVVLAAVPIDKDPDGFQYGQVAGACLSPVVGAIDEISERYNVVWEGKQVVVLGAGLLVGQPAAAYARHRGSMVTVLTKEAYDPVALLSADIIISGIGQPHFITPDMVKVGVVIFDAGTAEEGGVLAGDVDPTAVPKAALWTPVPGGIGPITIAYLFRNLVSSLSQ